MPERPYSDPQARPFEIAIVGNDMLLAALPGRSVQLAHAILATGFDLVVPVSWGEELLAEHALRVIEEPGVRPLIVCTCPLVRKRLLAAGDEMVPHLISTIAPPAATARYLRALQPDAAMRITYIGACPGAKDMAIDVRVSPIDFLRHLDQSGISIAQQPSVFEATIPPDRRRHWSRPGGVPAEELMRDRADGMQFVVIYGRDIVTEIAEHMINADRVLIDLAPALNCACSGAIDVHDSRDSREAVIALEPPRSLLPVLDLEPRIALELPIPKVPRAEPEPRVTRRSPTSAEPQGITSIRRAPSVRGERGRIAVTPAGVGAQERPTRGERGGRPNAILAQRLAVVREDVRHPEPAPVSPEVPAPAAPPAPSEASPGSLTLAPRTEEATPAGGAPVTPMELHRPGHRTPTYEMRLIARARSSTPGETPRLPRTWGIVRPRHLPMTTEPTVQSGESTPPSAERLAAGSVYVSPVVAEAQAGIPVTTAGQVPAPAPVSASELLSEPQPTVRYRVPRPHRAPPPAPIPNRFLGPVILLVLILAAAALVWVILARA